MRLTIIPSDKLVGVDNQFLSNLDLSTCAIPTNVHALQWYDVDGEVEFVDNPDRTKPQNEIVTKLPTWADSCIVVYNNTKAAAEKARLEAEAEKIIPATEI